MVAEMSRQRDGVRGLMFSFLRNLQLVAGLTVITGKH